MRDGTLLGFGDFERFFEDGVSDKESGAYGQAHGISVGASPTVVRRPVAKPATPIAKKGAPSASALKALKGRIKPTKTRNRGQASPHKAALASAAMAGKKAVAVANNIAKHVATYKRNVASGKHAPGVKLTAIGFGDYGEVVLGATPRVDKVLTPKQRLAVQKHAQAAARLSAVNKMLAQAAILAKKKGEAAKAFVLKAMPAVKKALIVAPFGGKTMVGAVAQYINERGGAHRLSDDEVEVLTEALADGLSGQQTEIGYLDDGYEGLSGYEDEIGMDGLSGAQTEIGDVPFADTLPGAPEGEPPVPGTDPALTAQPGGTMPLDGSMQVSPDSGSGQVVAPDGTVLYDPTTDPAVVPMPVRGQDLTVDELMEVWDKVPDDGFVYGESEGGTHYPPNSVGSVNVFFGTNKNANGWAPGLIFGGEDWLGPSPNDPNTFWHSTWPSTIAIQKRSLELGWGPLTGNPQGQLKNIQYAQADKKWFWQGKAAPVAYSAEADSKIAQANQATIAANRAAAVAQLKQMQADQAAATEAQTKQDAANALAESAASSQMNVAAAQQQVQQGQLDLQSQQAQQQMAQQAAQVQAQAQQALIQQSQQQAQVQAQAQQALIDEAATYNKWAAEHPEEAAAQMQAEAMSAQPADQGDIDAEDQGDGGGDDGGGDDGGEDDGSGDDGGGLSDDDLLSQDMDAE